MTFDDRSPPERLPWIGYTPCLREFLHLQVVVFWKAARRSEMELCCGRESENRDFDHHFFHGEAFGPGLCVTKDVLNDFACQKGISNHLESRQGCPGYRQTSGVNSY